MSLKLKSAGFALVVVLLLVAGCVSNLPGAVKPASVSPAGAWDPLGGFADPLITGHDHGDVSKHQLKTPTMEELMHVDLGVPSAVTGEADLLGKDSLVVASLAQGFYILDIKDRAHPKVTSFTPDVGYNADIKASASGNFVFLGVQLAGFTGIHAWNVAVKERPVLAGAFPMQGGCHMLAVHKTTLYCAPNDRTVRIFSIMETPAAVALVPVGMYAPKDAPMTPVQASQTSPDFTHDMTVQDDPVTGKAVMFVSFWAEGVHVVDVSDPAKPVKLGQWKGEGAPDTWGGNIHSTMAAMVNGKRVIATVPEYAKVPSITFLDATDYANMTVLGVWAPKTDFGGDAPSTFSTHNFQFVNGKVYLAMYHGGVWVVEASATPKALGYLLPAAAAAAPAKLPVFGVAPDVWDVIVKDGYVYAEDIASGVHVLHYLPDTPGDATITGFA